MHGYVNPFLCLRRRQTFKKIYYNIEHKYLYLSSASLKCFINKFHRFRKSN